MARARSTAVAAQWLANLRVSWSFKVLAGNSALDGIVHQSLADWLVGQPVRRPACRRFVSKNDRQDAAVDQAFWQPRAGGVAAASLEPDR